MLTMPYWEASGDEHKHSHDGDCRCDQSQNWRHRCTEPCRYARSVNAIPDMKELLISIIERTVTEIDIPEGTTKLVYSCLSGCTNLTVVGIPSTVTSIGIHSFRNCSSLQSIDIPSSVTSIDTQAFNGSGITQITVHKAQDSISGAPWGATNATITWTEEQSND